jgi:isopenicillin-N epimerase
MPATPEEIVEAAVAAMTERTRLFFFSHVLSPTGLVLPAQQLCAEARRRGILTLVDGAHALAMLPLQLDDLGADFYGANCHKWLLAPTGSGFLYLHPGTVDRLQPLQVSWGWQPDRGRGFDEPDEWGTTPRLRHLEFEGTRDICPWLAVPAALNFQEGLGWQRIRDRICQLADHVRRRLGILPNLRQWTPDHPELRGALTAYRLPAGVDAGKLRQRLWERHRIEAPIVERPDSLLIRVSTHFYNTEGEVDQLGEVLPDLLAS